MLAEMMLPDSQGEDTIAALSKATQSRIPIVILTNVEDSESDWRSLQHGAQKSSQRASAATPCSAARSSSRSRKHLELQLQEQAAFVKSVISIPVLYSGRIGKATPWDAINSSRTRPDSARPTRSLG
ncbi:MAG: hypothetical protein IPI48_18785 [bacterium]|nr:hypothetical protein [bacterium]